MGQRRAAPAPLLGKPSEGSGLFRVAADNVVYANRGETVRLPLNGATHALVESGLLQPVETPAPRSAPVETEREAADNG
jgi:hypothetical protein